LAGAGEQRHHLADLDVVADGACLLSAEQQVIDPLPEGLDGFGDLDLQACARQEVDDGFLGCRLSDHPGEEHE
jgi:hypothetical protein